MDDLSFDTLKKFSVRQSMTLSQLDAVMNADTTGVLHSLWEKDFVAADPYNAHYAECIEKKLLYPGDAEREERDLTEDPRGEP